MIAASCCDDLVLDNVVNAYKGGFVRKDELAKMLHLHKRRHRMKWRVKRGLKLTRNLIAPGLPTLVLTLMPMLNCFDALTCLIKNERLGIKQEMSEPPLQLQSESIW